MTTQPPPALISCDRDEARPRPLPPREPLGASALCESMRILLIVSEAPPIVSGISRCVERLVLGLQGRGHLVDTISAVDVPRFVHGEVRLSSFALHWRKMARRIPQYDVVNLHGPVPTMSDMFLLLQRTIPPSRRPRVVYTHHSAIDLPGHGLRLACALYNGAHLRLARGADRTVVSSSDYADLLTCPGGPPVDIVRWGVELDGLPTAWSAVPAPGAEEAASGRHRPLRVLFVGQMRPYKGVETLLRAVSGQRSLSLTLVGSGPLKEHYQAFASSVGAVNALFTGRLSDAELRQAYRDHDVVVLPSTSKAEAFGLVLLEGMAHGCVPVASDLPGVREVAGPTGHVVPPKDASALRDCLLCLADHPTLVTDLQARSRQRASTMTWERVAAEYETVFRTAVGQPPGHATRVRRKPAASLLRARA